MIIGMKKNDKILFICFLAATLVVQDFIFLYPVYAQQSTRVTVEKESLVEGPLTLAARENARKQSVESAKIQAISEFLNVNITSNALLVNNRLSCNERSAVPYCTVNEYRIIDEEIEEVKDSDNSLLKVKIDVWVNAIVRRDSPHFRIDTRLNDMFFKEFKEGEEMIITITPSIECYICAFLIFEDDKVIRLIPNYYRKKNIVKENASLVFPDRDDKEGGIRLKMYTVKDVSEEFLLILALKPSYYNQFKWIIGAVPDATRLVDNQNYRVYLKDIIKELAAIPVNDRIEQILPYRISKK